MLNSRLLWLFGFTCYGGLLLTGCNGPEPVAGPFVKTTYSDPTTEIVDHILFDMVGTDAFYEGWWEYQQRTGNHQPTGADTATQQAFLWRYKRERQLLSTNVMLVVWPRLSFLSITPERRALARQNIVGQLDAGKRESFRLNPPRLRFDSVDNQLYNQLLDSMRDVRLQVAEMKNTGRYTLLAPMAGPGGKIFRPPYRWVSSRGESELVGQFTVSEAVFNRRRNRACLLLERYYDHGSEAEFIFAERRNDRWILAKIRPFWIS